MKFIKRNLFAKLGLLIFFVALVIFFVGWRYTDLPVYKLVVHEITKATEDSSIIVSAPLSITGDISQTGNLSVSSGYFTSGVTKIDVSSGVTDQLTDDYNFYTVELPANPDLDSGVTLPAISASNSGMLVGFKIIGSGVSPFAISVYDTDGHGEYIECTRGTATATYCDSLDAQGDFMLFQADYTSGTTPVWRLLIDELS